MSAVPSPAEDNGGWTTSNEYLRAAVSEHSQYKVEGSHMDSYSGATLVEPSETVTLKTPHAETHISKGALLYTRLDKNSDHIFVLLGHAVVHVGKHSTSLRGGDEVIVTPKEPTTKDIVGDDIGRRRLRISTAPNGDTVALTEFSLVHAIERENLLYTLVHSDSEASKSIRERLIKMAAVLNFVMMPRHGQYTTNVR